MIRMTGLPLLLLLLFWLLPPTSAKRMQTECVLRKYFQLQKSYYRTGDLIIGGNLPLGTIISSKVPDFQNDPFMLSIPSVVKTVYSSFFRMNPKELPQYVGLVQLLLQFQWNWVGLLAPENDNGERFISTLMPMLKEKQICLAFIKLLNLDTIVIGGLKLFHIFQMWSKIEVIILFGDYSIISCVQVAVSIYEKLRKISFRKVWILTSHWKLSLVGSQYRLKYIKPFHGALHFRDHTGDVSEFSHFLLSLDPLKPQGDVFLPL
ncbi:hypothetical protein E2320_022383, partial [Naja naja]